MYIRVPLFVFTLLFSFSVAQATNIILSPSSGNYSVGKTFNVDVFVSNNKDSINAVSAGIDFSEELLELRSVSKSGSIITLWAEEPSFSNVTGKASLEGVILNPGFNSVQGKVLTLTFRAKNPGTASVTLVSGSVLANDGNATNILGTLGSANFSIIESTDNTNEETAPIRVSADTGSAPQVTSSSHPDSTKWYNAKEASFEWKVPSSVTAVRTLYDESPNSTPTRVYEPAIGNRSFLIDGNGVLYMHVQFRSGGSWGPVTHYKFQVDKDAPESVKASFPDGIVTSNPTPAVLVLATDNDSGIGHISMRVDEGSPVNYPYDSSNLYRIPKSSSGKHTVRISAVDKAGNASDVSLDYTVQAISEPNITEYTKTVDLSNTFKVAGTTYPQSIVEVMLTNKDGKEFTQTTTSDSNGLFTLRWSDDLVPGVYEMKARVIDSKGATSDYTDAKAIEVLQVALLRFGMFIMNWLSFVLILILAGVAIAATFWYSFNQFARFRRKVHHTMQEAENTLKANVAGLRRDIEEFRTVLMKAERKRDLTKEEKMILKKFKKRLDTTEKEIEKKLEQIG